MKEKFLIIFISGILSILLFLFVCSLTLYKTIFERKYIDNMLIKDGYYDKLYSSIQDKFKNVLFPLGNIDSININSIVDKKMIIRDVDIIISSIYDGDDIVIDTRELENNIDKVLNDSFSFNKITPNDEDKKKIGEFKNNIIKVYRDSIFLNVEKYLNGVSLDVGKNYNINALCGGIIVYIGDKENLGKTVIIQGTDGIDYWYSNITNLSVKLYDYIPKGTLIGESSNENIYLTFVKNGEYINYENFI